MPIGRPIGANDIILINTSNCLDILNFYSIKVFLLLVYHSHQGKTSVYL